MKVHPACWWRFILEFPSDEQESRRMLVFHKMKHRDIAGLNHEVSITKANGNINESTLQRVGWICENSQLTQVTSFLFYLFFLLKERHSISTRFNDGMCYSNNKT